MSLINDALKRARHAQRPGTRTGTAPLRPADPGRSENHAGRWLIAAIILLLVVASFFFGLAMTQRPARKSEVQSQSVEMPPATVAIAPVPAVLPVAAVAMQTSPSVAAPSKPLRVQAIVSDPVRPWAIVNGQTVYIGSLVEQMRVAAITRDSITLIGHGITNRLTVGH